MTRSAFKKIRFRPENNRFLKVSTWFANARRRLKKENKMTWVPKNRPENDDDENSDKDADEKGKFLIIIGLKNWENEFILILMDIFMVFEVL